MSSDEIQSNAIKFLIGFLSVISARYFPADINAQFASYLPTIASGIVAVGLFLYGVWMHRGQKLVPNGATAIELPGPKPEVGSSVNLTPMSGLAKVVGIILICLIVFSVSAHANAQYPDDQQFSAAVHHTVARMQVAQNHTTGNIVVAASAPVKEPAPTGKLTATQVQSDPISLLQKFTTSDLQAALADAQAQIPPDTTSAQCYTALLTIANSPLNNPLPSQMGLFLALQKARDARALLANLQSPNGPLANLNIACAPLVMSVNSTLLALGITTGLVVGTGGIAIPALPGLLSILPK